MYACIRMQNLCGPSLLVKQYYMSESLNSCIVYLHKKQRMNESRLIGLVSRLHVIWLYKVDHMIMAPQINKQTTCNFTEHSHNELLSQLILLNWTMFITARIH